MFGWKEVYLTTDRQAFGNALSKLTDQRIANKTKIRFAFP